jgi:hypothetical protein
MRAARSAAVSPGAEWSSSSRPSYPSEGNAEGDAEGPRGKRTIDEGGGAGGEGGGAEATRWPTMKAGPAAEVGGAGAVLECDDEPRGEGEAPRCVGGDERCDGEKRVSIALVGVMVPPGNPSDAHTGLSNGTALLW